MKWLYRSLFHTDKLDIPGVPQYTFGTPVDSDWVKKWKCYKIM